MAKSPFVFRKVYPFTWTVKVPDGPVPAFEFRAKFVGLTQSRMDEIVKQYPSTSDIMLAREAFTGWVEGDLVTEDGQPLLDSTENVNAVLDITWMRTPIVGAFLQAMSGLAAKN